MSVTTTAPPQKARTTAQNIGLILSFMVLAGIFIITYTGHIIYRWSSYNWCTRFCHHLVDDISCFLSSKCYHDYSTYRSTIRVLTESRSTC